MVLTSKYTPAHLLFRNDDRVARPVGGQHRLHLCKYLLVKGRTVVGECQGFKLDLDVRLIVVAAA